MIDVAVVGLGKMGLSHLSMIRAHPEVQLVGVCDATTYVLDLLAKYTAAPVYKDFVQMLDQAQPAAVIIATPTHLHARMVGQAVERGIHVFCEKPLVLDPREGHRLTQLARARGLVTQVGYHNRFVASFREVQRLVSSGALGSINTALAEAYGPVVLKPSGRTWRSRRLTGGGCLYDYAAHPLNLLTWCLGPPGAVSGSQLTSIFSTEIDDAVATTLHYPSGTAQLCVNWSDESQRKMTTKLSLWGTQGRIYADRQELQVFFRDTVPPPEGYRTGWNVRYTTDMTEAPWFYLRGEEYSAQLGTFVQRVKGGLIDGENDFASAAVTDEAIAMIIDDAGRQASRLTPAPATPNGSVRPVPAPEARSKRLRRPAAALGQRVRSVARAVRGRGQA